MKFIPDYLAILPAVWCSKSKYYICTTSSYIVSEVQLLPRFILLLICSPLLPVNALNLQTHLSPACSVLLMLPK